MVYVVPSAAGHECGVEADGVRRLRHEFVGADSREKAESYATWITGVLQRYCQVGEISFDFAREGC